MKPKKSKPEPVSKKATRNPKTVDAAAQSVKGRKSQSEDAAARRNQRVAATAGQKQIQGHQAASTRRSQGKRDAKNG